MESRWWWWYDYPTGPSFTPFTASLTLELEKFQDAPERIFPLHYFFTSHYCFTGPCMLGLRHTVREAWANKVILNNALHSSKYLQKVTTWASKSKNRIRVNLTVVSTGRLADTDWVSMCRPNMSPTDKGTFSVHCVRHPSRFNLEAPLKTHMKHHMNEKRFSCEKCSFKAHYASVLVQHAKRVHEKLRPFHCSLPACDFRSFAAKDLNIHIDTRHNPHRSREFPCPLCTKNFYSKHELQKHITFVHTNESLHTCDKCDFTTRYKLTWQQHRARMHQKVEPGACEYEKCKFPAGVEGHKDKHVRAVQGPGKQLNCKSSDCGYKTRYTRSLQIHALCHEEDLDKKFPFACTFPNECDFRSRTEPGIKLHHRRHQTPKRPLRRCKFCPSKRYPDRHSLQFHKWAVHNSKSYDCSMCNYSSWKSEHLANHSRLCHRPSEPTRLLTDNVSNASERDTSPGDNKQSTGAHLAIVTNEPVDKLSNRLNNFLGIPVVCLPRICMEMMWFLWTGHPNLFSRLQTHKQCVYHVHKIMCFS